MRNLFRLNNIVKMYVLVEKALYIGLIEAGLAPRKCLEVVDKCMHIEPDEIYDMEKKIGHDIAALSYILAQRCGECGAYIHLGATSYDIVDTAWSLLLRDALKLVKQKLRIVIETLINYAVRYLDVVMVGRTHGQHAIPITLGFKFANYVYELARSYERICDATKRVLRSKIAGAVGTMAAWRDRGLIVEQKASQVLGLEPHAITTQIAPRDGFAELVSVLAILASQLDRLALEIRELSRPEIAEVVETHDYVGSSAMPHKNNPVLAERISGLAKIMRALVVTALENIPLMHERDLTNSSSERILIPHIFMIIDQMLMDTINMLRSLRIDEEAMRRNLELSKGFIMSEAVVVKLVEKGVPRHVAHQHLVTLTKRANNRSFKEVLLEDSFIRRYLSPSEIDEVLDCRKYLGCYKQLVERAINYAKNAMARC